MKSILKSILKSNRNGAVRRRLLQAFLGTIATASFVTLGVAAPALAQEGDQSVASPDAVVQADPQIGDALTNFGETNPHKQNRALATVGEIGQGIRNFPLDSSERSTGSTEGLNDCPECEIGESINNFPDGWEEGVDGIITGQGEVGEGISNETPGWESKVGGVTDGCGECEIGEGIINYPPGWEEGVDGIEDGCQSCEIGEGIIKYPDGYDPNDPNLGMPDPDEGDNQGSEDPNGNGSDGGNEDSGDPSGEGSEGDGGEEGGNPAPQPAVVVPEVTDPGTEVDGDLGPVESTRSFATPQVTYKSASSQVKSAAAPELPKTGAAVTGAVVGGVALLALGGAAYYMSRKNDRNKS